MKPRLAMLATLLLTGVASAEEFNFDASEFEKKTFEYAGYFEQKEQLFNLRQGSPAYKLAYPDANGQELLLNSTSSLQLGGKINLDTLTIDLLGQGNFQTNEFNSTYNYGEILDGGLRWSASTNLSLDIGKRVQRWGTGYAWDPVGFVERPKNPSDLSAAREGFVMAGGTWTQSLSGPISNLGITALVVPTTNDLNPDFGKTSAINPAAKLSMLAFDTDIDLMWRGEGARAQSFGFDFSRNLNSAFEIHGEWARSFNAPRPTLNSAGSVSANYINYNAYLLGARYLSESGVTWIAEYYHNGGGYTASEMDQYYDFIDQAMASGAATSLINKARSIAQAGYGKVNPGRNYLYLKPSMSEPFDWLYSNIAITAMMNADDYSWQITPELSYTGFANWELRTRLIFFGGPSGGEFTEKPSSSQIEVYARYYF